MWVAETFLSCSGSKGYLVWGIDMTGRHSDSRKRGLKEHLSAYPRKIYEQVSRNTSGFVITFFESPRASGDPGSFMKNVKTPSGKYILGVPNRNRFRSGR
jgi:hypothetical protein